MFSPSGKKQLLLQHKFGGNRSRSPSPLHSQSIPISDERSRSPNDQRRNLKDQLPSTIVAASSRLETALSDVGSLGFAMNKLMDSTQRYRPEKDGILLKSLESKEISFESFRQSLRTIFWLDFTEDEFSALIQYFDPNKNSKIDGYSFIKAYIRLTGIRKERVSLEIREKQELFERNKKDKEERLKFANEKKLFSAVNYNFTPDIKRIAYQKLEEAAFKFDPGHPSAPSTKGFQVDFLKPLEFREMIKLTLGLKVDEYELGAILKRFKQDIELNIPANEFLRFFLRLGIDLRETERIEQRKKQKLLDEKAKEEMLQKETEKKNKLKLHVDFNYDEMDEMNAMEKIKIASTKYDQNTPGCPSLDGFECEELSPLDFKGLIKKVFNLSLTPTELGFIIQKYDIKKSGNVHCKTFLVEFLKLGYEIRHKSHLDQLDKQKKALEDQEKKHLEKIKQVQTSEKVYISQNYTDDDLQSALKKLTHSAVHYDKERNGSLISFEPQSLSTLEFKRALKRTFNIEFTAKEMGAIIHYIESDENNNIVCKHFLTIFVTLGANERAKIKSEQIKKQRDALQKQAEEAEKKRVDLDNKILYEVDFDFTEDDYDSAIEKMTIAATKFDSKHPAALSLQAFEVKSMSGATFKEIVRRTFHLELSSKEVGAIIKFFENRSTSTTKIPPDHIDSTDFIKYFLQLGILERGKFHRDQLEKQRKEDQDREISIKKKLFEAANRNVYQPDSEFTDLDKESILKKIEIAAEKFDKNHSSAPSLETFSVAYMTPGVFRENIKSIFNIVATPKEIGYLLTVYDKDKNGKFHVKEFLNKFFSLGQKIRHAKRKEFLDKQIEYEKEQKKKEEEKLVALLEKNDFSLDGLQETEEDFPNAVKKMTEASVLYDKNHISAPNLSGFHNGPLTSGVLRELMKNLFRIVFTPGEILSLLNRFHMASNTSFFDNKKFLNFFIKLGFDERHRLKLEKLNQQRKYERELLQKQEIKLNLLQAKSSLLLTSGSDAGELYSDEDRESAYSKITQASFLYHTSSSGANESLFNIFNTLFLTPNHFREILKSKFFVTLTVKELLVLLQDFAYRKTDSDEDSNSLGYTANLSSNIDTKKFLLTFIKLGLEEKEKQSLIQQERQKKIELTEQKKKEKLLESLTNKNKLDLSYEFNDQDKASAFQKLAVVAKKYDKVHSSSLSLEGFDCYDMEPHIFREMLKKIFNFIPSNPELNAIFHYFDKKNTGRIICKDFLVYFLKLGIFERYKDYSASLASLKQKQMQDKKISEDKKQLMLSKKDVMFMQRMQSQFLKKKSSTTFNTSESTTSNALSIPSSSIGNIDNTFDPKLIFSEEDRQSALNKLEYAASLYDGSSNDSNNPISLKNIFSTAFLTPYYFREMLKKCLNINLTDKEFLSLVKEFDINNNMTVDCHEFTTKFQLLCNKSKSKLRLEAIEKQRVLNQKYSSDIQKRIALKEEKHHIPIESISYSDDDFVSVFNKINTLASNYQRNHPSAPNLTGFSGVNMTAFEFKEMFSRSFRISITNEELAALFAYFPIHQNESSKSDTNKNLEIETKEESKDTDSKLVMRINNQEFLNYFYKMSLVHSNKRNEEYIQKIRLKKEKLLEEQNRREENKINSMKSKLEYTEADEALLLANLHKSCQEFAIDSSPYIDSIQSFKGPSLPVEKFKDLFYNIFQIKLTFPELGILLHLFDELQVGMIDGNKFLSWFFKLSRKKEKFLLGESREDISLNDFKIENFRTITFTRPNTHSKPTNTAKKPKSNKENQNLSETSQTSRSPSPEQIVNSALSVQSSSSSRTQTSKSLSSLKVKSWNSWNANEFKNYEESSLQGNNNDFDSFMKSTLNQSWLLPSIATANSNANSFDNLEFQEENSSEYDSQIFSESNNFLSDLFKADSIEDSRLFTATIETNSSSRIPKKRSSQAEMEELLKNYIEKEAQDLYSSILTNQSSNKKIDPYRIQTAPQGLGSSRNTLKPKTAKSLPKLQKNLTSPNIIIPMEFNNEKSPLSESKQISTDSITNSPNQLSMFHPNKKIDKLSAISLSSSLDLPVNTKSQNEFLEPLESTHSQKELLFLAELFESTDKLINQKFGSTSHQEVSDKANSFDPVKQLHILNKKIKESPINIITDKKFSHKKVTKHLKSPLLTSSTIIMPVENFQRHNQRKSDTNPGHKQIHQSQTPGGFFFPSLLTANMQDLPKNSFEESFHEILGFEVKQDNSHLNNINNNINGIPNVAIAGIDNDETFSSN